MPDARRRQTVVEIVAGAVDPGASSRSIELDGVSKHLAGGDVHKFVKADPFSLFIWVKSDNAATDQHLISKQDNAGANKGYAVTFNGGSVRCLLRGDGANRLQITITGATPSSNVWHLVGLTYDGSETIAGLKGYLDGVEPARTEDSTSLGGTDIDGTFAFEVSSRGGGSRFLDGNTAEAYVFNFALTPANVLAFYNGGVPIDPGTLGFAANPVGWWRMGQGSDVHPTFVDNGTGGNNLTGTNTQAIDITTDVPFV